MAVAVLTIIKHVLGGLSVYGPGEPIKQADAQTVFEALNTVLDDWAAETAASYAETFVSLAFSGANPQLIGPGAPSPWAMDARPPVIDGVSIDDGSGRYRRIYTTNDAAWWNAQQLPNISVMGGAYYSADEPNGLLYFSAPPSAGTLIRLMMPTTLGPVLETDVLTLPQGYQSALELTVMEAVADAFHATLTPNQIRRAGIARGRIFSKNLRIPTLSTRRLGLPGRDVYPWWKEGMP